MNMEENMSAKFIFGNNSTGAFSSLMFENAIEWALENVIENRNNAILATLYFSIGVAYGLGRKNGIDDVRYLAREELVNCKVGNICPLYSIGVTVALNNRARVWDGLGDKEE